MTPAEVDAADDDGWTALHLAAFKGLDHICGVLLGAGARLDAKASGCWTPLMVALRYQPTNAALHALLSGDGLTQPLNLVCDHCGKTAEEASVRSLKDTVANATQCAIAARNASSPPGRGTKRRARRG